MLSNSPVFAKSPELRQQLPAAVPYFAQQVISGVCFFYSAEYCCWMLTDLIDLLPSQCQNMLR